MDMELSGKQAVVTGASRGIGLAIVEALVAEGVSVVAGARHRGALPAEVEVVEVDLTTAEGAGALIDGRRARPSAAGSTSWSTTSAPCIRARAASGRSPTRSGSRR